MACDACDCDSCARERGECIDCRDKDREIEELKRQLANKPFAEVIRQIRTTPSIPPPVATWDSTSAPCCVCRDPRNRNKPLGIASATVAATACASLIEASQPEELTTTM